jgi:hypothetical protein
MVTETYREGYRVSPTNGTGRVPRSSALTPGWPRPSAPEAYYGLFGDVVRAVEPHSEADPVALLSQGLAFFGNVVGPGPRFRVEGDFHRTNLGLNQVGETSKGRKGTSLGRVKEVFATTDPTWMKTRISSGLSSGEGLVWNVRDEDPNADEEENVQEEVIDKRLLVIEPEFSRVLKMAGRDGNCLSDVIREAWDSGNLGVMNKNSPVFATGAHITIIGHITQSELRRRLSETEQANGFANRFLWVCVRRSKCLPDDEDRRVDPEVLARLQARVKRALDFARNV